MKDASAGAFAAWVGCLTAIACAQPAAPPAVTTAAARTSPETAASTPAANGLDPAGLDSFIAARRLPASVDCEPRRELPAPSKGPDGGAPAPMSPQSHDKEVIRRIIRSHVDAVRRCYEAVLIEPPYPRGRVMARILISGTGNVTSTCVVNTTLNRLEAERCIVDEALTWRFPKPLGGGLIVVDYPFVLEPTPESN
jgi:hypothetical protein